MAHTLISSKLSFICGSCVSKKGLYYKIFDISGDNVSYSNDVFLIQVLQDN